jgi:hypothetical protein
MLDAGYWMLDTGYSLNSLSLAPYAFNPLTLNP